MFLKRTLALIAYRLFKDEFPQPEPAPVPVTTRLLDTHEAHEDFIAWAIQEAKRNLLIVSPTISIKRLTTKLSTDRFNGSLSDLFKVHANTKNIRIICSDDLNREPDGAFKACYELGIDSLIKTGCKVNRKQRVHHKTIAIDRSLITEGSYNWLGIRPNHRREKTVVCEGPEVEQRVAEEWIWQRTNKKGFIPGSHNNFKGIPF